MKDFQNVQELLAYIDETYEKNQWAYPKNVLLAALLEKWASIQWNNLVDIMSQNEEFSDKLTDAVNKPANQIDFEALWNALSFGDEKKWDDEDEDKKTIYNSRNYDALKDFVKKYNELVNQKEEKLSEYNNFKWYNEKTWVIDKAKQEIEDINTKLKEMEDWDEFKELLQSIKDYWMWTKFSEDDSYIRFWVDNIINKRWSAIEKNNALKKFFMWSNMVSDTHKNMDELIDWFLWWKSDIKKEKQLNPEFVEKNKDNEKLGPEFRKKLQELYNKQQWNKDTKMQSSIWDKEVTDNMKFWNDVTSGIIL